MNNIGFIIALVIAIIALVIAAILAVRAAASLAAFGLKDAPLARAHSYMTVASVIAWLAVAVLIILGIFAIYISVRESNATIFNSAKIADHTPTIMTITLGLVGAIVFIVGVLGALASSDITKSGSKDARNVHDAYNAAIGVAITGILGTITAVVAALVFWAAEHKYRRNDADSDVKKAVAAAPVKSVEVKAAKPVEVKSAVPAKVVDTGAIKIAPVKPGPVEAGSFVVETG